nr:hypothetical protein [Paracoccus saliphilus]
MAEATTQPAETEEDRQMARTLARAIWLSTQKAGGNQAEPGSDEMRASWEEAKKDMVRIANMTLRRLEAKGLELVQK